MAAIRKLQLLGVSSKPFFPLRSFRGWKIWARDGRMASAE
jgi:hypothetical protein